MSYVGIVGHEQAKFTLETGLKARDLIKTLIVPGDTVVSGGCHLGGVDIWAELIARDRGNPTLIFKPDRLTWTLEPPLMGYKERNIKIAEASEILHVVVVKALPPHFTGMTHKECYHCHVGTHIKSGGCWTGKHAQHLGKPAIWWEL